MATTREYDLMVQRLMAGKTIAAKDNPVGSNLVPHRKRGRPLGSRNKPKVK